jgi:hypothetical protein
MRQRLENPMRSIGVGIRDVRRDAAALRWAVFDARPGRDVVRILHAVEPFDGRLTGWQPVSAAVENGHRQRSSVAIIGSPTAGAPERVLQAESDELALLVLGDDEPAIPHRRIAAHLRRTAHCPVVCVPRGTSMFEDRPVTVVADDLGLSDQVLEFAAQYAERHHVSLEIARTWRSLHREATADPATLADEHTQLDAELTGLRRSHPNVAVATRIELDDCWLERARAHSSLVVVGRTTADRLGMTSPLIEPLCPIAFIPDRWLG